VTVPEFAVGPFPITAIGKDASGNLYTGKVSLTVVPAVALERLVVSPPSIVLSSQAPQISLAVEGVYADATVRDLTGGVSGTTYESSDAAVAVIDANGLVQARGNGAAIVTVRNGAVSGTATVVVESETDLAVSQVASPKFVAPGGEMTYTLTIENLGPETARDVQVEDRLPPGSTFVSAAADDWTCVEASGAVTCYRAAFAAGDSSIVSIRANAPTVAGTTSNRVAIRSSSGDGNVENNVSVLTFDVLPIDGDGDGVPDEVDNCTLLSNATQVDADGDRYGNRCDPDFNNDGVVTAADYLLLRAKLNTTDPLVDLNGDGVVTAADYLILRGYLNKPPGPSGLVP